MSAVYEEGRPLERATLDTLAAELDFDTSDTRIEAGLESLQELTLEAIDDEVTGVPSFMLSRWPLGGIQSDDTMRSILTRFAERQRQSAGADAKEGAR